MIRLIVSDLDGTLLHSDKTYSEKIIPLIDRLRKEGIIFAIATGRSICVIQDQFPEFLERAAIICENGCALLKDNGILHRAKMHADDIREILAAGSNIDGLFPLLCGTKCGYARRDTDPRIIRYFEFYFTRLELVKSLEDVMSFDDICKVSFWDDIDPVTNGHPKMRLPDSRYQVIPSGGNWLDALLAGEDKGSCLRRLQEITGVSPDETMCFGDFMNDVGLMENCRYSYAMKDSHPDFRVSCAYETRLSNDEDGVVDTIVERTGIHVP